MPCALLERLAALPHPVGAAEAQGVEQVASNLTEALAFLGREPDGQAQPHLKHWRELFAEREQRLYYVNDEVGYNSWAAPPYFKFQEWALDSQLYGIPLRLARDIYETLDAFLTCHPPEVVYKALAVLARLISNVADCGNSVEKFRSVTVENSKFKAAVWDVPGAAQILFMVGFKRQGGSLSVGGDAPLGPLQAAAARLRCLADRKGHSGTAEHVKPEGTDGSGRPASPFYGQPGFRYQEQIWHCSVCDHAINDGSERLWTGRHDAPHGEYRYLCTTCQDEGCTFNLCQDCWDRFQQHERTAAGCSGSASSDTAAGAAARAAGATGAAGAAGSSSSLGRPLHDPRHAFQHIGPRMTRHNDYYHHGEGGGANPSNPGGNRAAAGASYGRALQRLGERYGIRHWG
ncbi:hypothetical protein ABPG75_000367 [Micractinium tetrahymenae]